MAILSVNAGSSSLKFSVHPWIDGQVQPALWQGLFEGLEPQGQPRWKGSGRDRPSWQAELDLSAHAHPFDAAWACLQQKLNEDSGTRSLKAVAHRVVHGGGVFDGPVVVDAQVMETLKGFCSLAPLHQPHNLRGIEALARFFPDLPQVACFDTAYHAGLSPAETTFALPKALRDQGLRRYGFHGLSYHYLMQTLQEHSARANDKVIMAHLGNGASLCAARQGRSIGTSMGYTALDGLIMGTRPGSMDPGVLLHLVEQGWSAERLQTLLYRESGLLGLSGVSADMRALHASTDPQARLALEVFVARLVREFGAMVACNDGLDVLVFAGGIGENDAWVRQQVCHRLAWLGIGLDPEANRRAKGDRVRAIHGPDSVVEVWVIPTDEAWLAAKEAARILAARPS